MKKRSEELDATAAVSAAGRVIEEARQVREWREDARREDAEWRRHLWSIAEDGLGAKRKRHGVRLAFGALSILCRQVGPNGTRLEREADLVEARRKAGALIQWRLQREYRAAQADQAVCTRD